MNHASYLKANVDSVHKRWIENIRDIREVTDPASRSVFLEDLKYLYQQAQALETEQTLHPHQRGALQHILQRSIKDHLTALKTTTKRNLL